jgi:hypothetical protein
MLYRIYTERKNEETIEKIVGKYFEGFSILKSEGFWRLQKEDSLIIEIVAEDTDKLINDLAKEIKVANNQEAILIQKINNNQWLI